MCRQFVPFSDYRRKKRFIVGFGASRYDPDVVRVTQVI